MKRLARIFAACRVNESRNIHLNHLFVERIPIFIAHRRRLAVSFARIRVDHDPDKTEIVDATIDLVKGVLDAYAGVSRQTADSTKFLRLYLDLQSQRVIDRLAIPMNDLLRLRRV